MMKCSEKGRGRGWSMLDRGREMRRKREGKRESERVKGKRAKQRMTERQEGDEEIIAADKQGGSEKRKKRKG